MKSPITNCYDPKARRPKLDAETVHLYRPERKWTYSHHPHITFFKDRFYAMWSNGRIHEDDVGQRILMSTAEDFQTWSEPEPLVDSLMGKHSELVLTAAGFHQHAGTLVAYFGQYEYTPESLENGTRRKGDTGHMNTGLRAVATTDGHQWSPPMESLALPSMHLPIVPNHGPQQTASGRLIISGNIMFPYTDDPSGLSGWNATGIYPSEMSAYVYDDSEYFWKVREKMGWPVGLCEGSFYQTDDGMIYMLLRSNVDKLWVTESRDDGVTWSAPSETDFTDNATKFHFGRLPDGRFYYVGCPDPTPRGRRNPLVLSLSEDGVRFDRHFILGDEEYEQKVPGMHKGGTYGYPHTMILDKCLYVVFSICKEGVAVSRIRWDRIGWGSIQSSASAK